MKYGKRRQAPTWIIVIGLLVVSVLIVFAEDLADLALRALGG